MKRLNKAFTLTELLVALGVIGILCAILLPIIFNIMPNKSTIMAKRVYYTVQTVVSDLINDEACYPDLTSASDTEKELDLMMALAIRTVQRGVELSTLKLLIQRVILM